MATDPFTAAFSGRLTELTLGYQFRCWLGEVVHFLYFCCDYPPNLGVTKAPVAKLSLDPDIVCLGDPINYSVVGSYAPLGTLLQYQITWGDGGITIVGPPIGVWTGAYTYVRTGSYRVRLRVQDQLGAWGEVTVNVVVVDCDAAPAVLASRFYALSQIQGPFIRDAGDAVWTQMAAGLDFPSHPDWMLGRDLKLDPHRKHLPEGARHVWIATRRGPTKSTTDTLFWRQLRDRLPDPDGATVEDLDFYCITFNPISRDEVYLLAATALRAWVYYSYDGGLTWASWPVRY